MDFETTIQRVKSEVSGALDDIARSPEKADRNAEMLDRIIQLMTLLRTMIPKGEGQ